MAKAIFQQTGSALTAHITGRIDRRAAMELRGQIEGQLERLGSTHLCLEMNGAHFIDPDGKNLLLGQKWNLADEEWRKQV